LGSDSSIDYALSAGRERGLYWRIALLWRAILVDHPFTDVNKRTALNVAFLMLERNDVNLNDEAKNRITKSVLEVAQKNITSIKNIERRVRYAVKGN